MIIEEKPLISIIVPIYNAERFLNKCIESILNQTYKNLEIILVDDGSTDETAAICDEYKKKDARIVVIHQENKGLPASRNVGLHISKGDYIFFVDSDDWIDDDCILMLFFQLQHDDADVCMAKEIGCYYNDTIFERMEVWTTSKVDEYVDAVSFIKYCQSKGFCDNRKLIKRSLVFDSNGDSVLFDESLGWGEDFYFHFKLSEHKRYKMTTSLKAIYFYRKDVSLSGIKKWQNKKMKNLINLLFFVIRDNKYKPIINGSEFITFYNSAFLSRYYYAVKKFYFLEIISYFKKRCHYFAHNKSIKNFVYMFFPFIFYLFSKFKSFS